MNRKILNLIIAVLILIVIILGLVIWQLAGVEKDSEVKPAPVAETTELEAVPIEDPVGEDGMKIHTSETGYSVKYPADITAKSMAKSLDFLLDDNESGSSLNIVTAKNDGTLKEMTREEFEYSLLHTSEDSYLLSYEKIMLNGIEAVAAEYVYIDNVVKQYFVFTDAYGYSITVMKSEYISDEMSAIFDSVVESFTLRHSGIPN